MRRNDRTTKSFSLQRVVSRSLAVLLVDIVRSQIL
jgi:hypothetical protein